MCERVPRMVWCYWIYESTRSIFQLGTNLFSCRLQNQVIDLEVANRTASPTVDPSVHVFLVGHSMGGMVAAETLLLVASEQPIPPKHADPLVDSGTADNAPAIEPGSFMFPHIQGVLAFDTPFLGIAPGVVSYGAEGHYRNATSAYNTISEVAGLFGLGGAAASSKGGGANQPKRGQEASPSQSGNKAPPNDAAATPSWQRWGRYAMFAGAAGAVAAGGAAAMYSQRDRLGLTDGWGWVSSHLAFVGCLARPSELRQRLVLLSKVHEERGIGCTNFFTCLGQGAGSLVENRDQAQTSFSQKIIRSKHRTFCTLPTELEGQDMRFLPAPGLGWARATNDKAGDEVKAHVTMFLPKDNPAFYDLVNDACRVLVKSVDKGWYAGATTTPVEEVPRSENGRSQANTDSGFMDGDDVVVVE